MGRKKVIQRLVHFLRIFHFGNDRALFALQMGDTVFTPGGLHPGVHDRIGSNGYTRQGVQEEKREANRYVLRQAAGPQRLGRCKSPKFMPSSMTSLSVFLYASKILQDIKSYCPDLCGNFPFPIIADEKRELAVLLDMITEDDRNNPEVAMTVRALYIIGPDHKLKLSMVYPFSTGRNVE